jgi:uncharacterized repeat protein (TIGR03803 family)
MDGAGNLYGVLLVGTGVNDTGAVFKLSRNGDGTWTETILTSPDAGPHVPFGALTLDAAGNLYGVTFDGGTGPCGDGNCGTIFELSPPAKNAKKWKYTKLYRFLGPKAGDGSSPNGNLVFDSAGNLYGTTLDGGASGYGTVFELSSGPLGWTEKILFNFGNYADGQHPSAGLIFDDHGNLYGTTYGGGDGAMGAVFELSPSGGSWTEKVLYSFLELKNGTGPQGPLVFHKGNLYATTGSGGAQQGDVGVVFKLSPSGGTWKETVLHSFSGPPSDGWEPAGGVVFDRHGNLYGVANGGGSGNGVIYEIPR